MSSGVYVLWVMYPGGKCPGGICSWGMCPWGKCPVLNCPLTSSHRTTFFIVLLNRYLRIITMA